MATPIVIVSSGGVPVTEATNGYGAPVTVATNGFGTPVTVVASGGLPVVGSGIVPTLPMLAIATRGVGPSGVLPLGGAGDSNYTRFESRFLHYSGSDPITALQAEIGGFYMATAGGEAAMPNAHTDQVAIEYSGQVKILTWDGGATSKLIPVSPLTTYISDYTDLGFTIPPNTPFFVHTGAVVSSGQIVYITDIRAAGSTNDTMFRSTAATSQVGTLGPWSTPPGGSNTNIGGGLSPISLKARRAAGSKSLYILGDSIAYGTADSAGDGNGNSGYIARAAYIGDGVNKLPYTKMARPSETASNMAGTKGDVRRSTFPGHSIFVSEFGMNDLGFASATVAATPMDKATVIANLKQNYLNDIWAPAKAAGCKVYQTKITPRVKGPNITQLTSSGSTVTATVKGSQPVPTNGAVINIVGASPNTYNGSVTVTSSGPGQTFTYTTVGAVTPASSPATLQAGFGTIAWNDGYTTTANQIPDDGFEPGGLLRDVINAWFDTQVGVTIDGVLDPNPGIELYISGVPQGIFQTSGGARTTDGLHPNGLGAGGGATQIAAALYTAA